MIRLAFVLGLTLVLSGCHEHFRPHWPNNDSNSEASADRDDTIAEVQRRARQICQFVPTANTILQILDLAVPGLSQAGQIATAICKEIEKSQGGTTTKSLDGPDTPQLRGVTIEGEFV